MRVNELCICDVAAAGPETTLRRAGALMHKYDIGSLPVIDEDERVIGMVTDRDLLIELARRDERPSALTVDRIMTEDPATCGPDDDVLDALDTMCENRVRRLPVVDDEGRLQGMLSIDDIVAHAAENGGREIPYDAVIETLADIIDEYAAESGQRCSHRLGDETRRRRRFEREAV